MKLAEVVWRIWWFSHWKDIVILGLVCAVVLHLVLIWGIKGVGGKGRLGGGQRKSREGFGERRGV